MQTTMRERVRPIALTIGAPLFGFVFVLFLELALSIELSKMAASVFNLIFVSFIAFYVFPRILGIPFGKVETAEFLHRLGFYLPGNAVKHIILGVVLAAISLSGMLIGSLISGLYVFDPGTINLPHVVFSLNPGMWEELFYRGVLMALLLRETKSIERASLIQVLIFSLMHVKGFDLWSLVDVFTVTLLALSFTYTATKTRSLAAGVLFHFLHDAFLFVVQVPKDVTLTNTQNAVFFASLWIAVGIGCLVTKFSAERLGVQEKEELYKVEK